MSNSNESLDTSENSSDRSRKIPIEDVNLNLQNIKNAPVTFNLGVQPAQFAPKPNSAPQNTSILLPKTPSVESSLESSSNRPIFGITPPHHESTFSPPLPPPKLSHPAKLPKPAKTSSKPAFAQKLWHGLEFLSMTGAIFMIFFLILNFDSYSRLFISKLDQLRGNIATQNPYTLEQNQILKNSSPQAQQPLPILQNPDATKKQIPSLDLEVAPPDERILIPSIDQNVPIVRVPQDKLLQRDWAGLETQIQDALRHGVVHFPGTAYPGDHGNIVITGHSSYFPWDPGRFKDVFASLHQVKIGDTVIVYHEQKKYEYIVYNKIVVHPEQVDVLTQNGEDKLTLITCTPVGTALNRLVIQAKPVNPVTN